MQTLTQPDQLRRFFALLGERCPRPARLYLFGGSALLWLGGPRHTADVDVTWDPADAAFRELVQATAAELDLDVEESIPADFMPLPAGHWARHIHLGDFGNLSVYLFDPYSIALMKLDRAFESDLEDVRYLLANGHLQLETLALLLEDVAARFDEPIRLRQQFEVFRKTL